LKRAAFAYALVLFFGVAYDLTRMPLQVFDSLEEILDAQQSPGVGASFVGGFQTSSYLRPLRVTQTKILFDAAGGHYFAAYKGFHITLLLAAFWLFVRALRVETPADLAAAVFALTVFTGMHTFIGTLKEAFPVNHFLEIVVFSLAALNLVQARRRWWTDAAAVLLLAVACLTLESGVLVWVVIVAGYVVGWRGVSRGALIAATTVLIAYLAIRFAWVDAGIGSMESASGYGVAALEPAQIRERFAGRMWLFYAYTTMSQVLSVLFAEPRHGVWIAVRSSLAGDLPPRLLINVLTSAATTLLIAIASVGVWRQQGAGRRCLLVSAAVLAANALLSFAYAKDEIISVAGAFYALAAYAALRHLLNRPHGGLHAVVLAVMMTVAGLGWCVRTLGVHHVLRTQAFNHHNDWAEVESFLESRGSALSEPGARALVRRLQAEALAMPVSNPWFMQRWAERVFDADY
jgi:hypothetical protein